MYVSQHIILGAIFAIVLFLIYPSLGLIPVSIIFISSVLIDVDHYVYYGLKEKDWNLKRIYKRCMDRTHRFRSLPREKRNKTFCGIFFLHGIEILMLVFLFSFIWNPYFFYIFIGLSFHLLLDIVDGAVYIDRIDKVSVLWDWRKFRGFNNI